MIIYAESIHIDKIIEVNFKNWIIDTLIPTFLKTNYFKKIIFSKVLIEESQIIFSIQYFLEDYDQLDQLNKNHPLLSKKMIQEEFNGKAYVFSTILEVIEESE